MGMTSTQLLTCGLNLDIQIIYMTIRGAML